MDDQIMKEHKFPLSVDPLSRLLNKMQASPIVLFIAFFAVNIIVNLTLAFSYDAWNSLGTRKGLVNDPAGWAIDFLMQPTFLAYFLWVQSSSNKLLRSLFNEGILPSNGKTDEILSKRKKQIESPIIFYFSICLTIITSVWFVATYTDYIGPTASQGWLTASPIIVWIRLPFVVLTTYTVIILLFNLVSLIQTLNQLFQNEIHLNPLHPDKSGGLGIIGKFSANLGYAIGALGLTVSLVIASEPTSVFISSMLLPVLLMIVLYIILVPIIFFAPLMSAHKAMCRYKNRLLENLSEEFNSTFAQLQEEHSKDDKEYENLLKKIRHLKEEHTIIGEFPVWPFNLASIRKYSSLVFSPLIPAVVSIGIDLLI